MCLRSRRNKWKNPSCGVNTVTWCYVLCILATLLQSLTVEAALFWIEGPRCGNAPTASSSSSSYLGNFCYARSTEIHLSNHSMDVRLNEFRLTLLTRRLRFFFFFFHHSNEIKFYIDLLILCFIEKFFKKNGILF